MSMSSAELLYYSEEGYRPGASHQMFGRSATLGSGEAVEGLYREVDAAQMFGPSAELGTGGDYMPTVESLTTMPLFQSIVVLTFIVYLVMLLRSWGFIGSIWSDIFKTDSDSRMVFEGGELPLQRFKRTAALLGIFVVALVVVRLVDGFIPDDVALYDIPVASLSPLVSLLLVVVLVAWLYAYHKVVGWVAATDNLAMLSAIGYTNFVRMVVLLYPLTAVWLLHAGGDAMVYNILLGISCGVLLLLYLKDTFVFFISKKVSIFFWILYLCTAILLPCSFFVRLLPERLLLL